MDVSHVNWAYVGLGLFGALAVAWITRLRRGKPGPIALIASVALLITAGLNAAAPWRGVLDPHYAGYRFGLLHADAGWAVSAIAGAVFLLAAAGAFAALETGRRAATLTALACLAFALIIGLPWSRQAFAHPEANVIQFGGYLTIPGLVSTWLLFGVLILPFLLGLAWGGARSLRR
jgi:hypothetical protein